VFTRTKHGANKVSEHLSRTGVVAEANHGNKSQNARQRALDMFKTGKARVLVATDIAARGIDVDNISHVVNFELPNEPESYVHRIGRTARAGGEGIAISFCDSSERSYLRDIERIIRMKIEPVAHELPELTEDQRKQQEEPRRPPRSSPRQAAWSQGQRSQARWRTRRGFAAWRPPCACEAQRFAAALASRQ
jgi:ATP-dependent RNA helicase RhlE